MTKKKPSPLSRYVIRARERRGWTRAELARKAELPYTTLRNVEAAEKNVHTAEENLLKIAGALAEAEQDQVDMFEQMRILAGYHIIASQDASERDIRLLANIDAYPNLRASLEELFSRGDAEEIDSANTALEFARHRHARRPKEHR
jgi:transcriptional regulator with XRE-family HTH domain